MFCSECGTQVPDDSTFCHNCGSGIVATPAPPAAESPPTPPAQQAQPVQPQVAAQQQPVAAAAQVPGMAGFQCGSCGRAALPDRRFCIYCAGFLASPEAGRMGGLFQRWLANGVDIFVGWVALIIILVVAVSAEDAGPVLALLMAAGWIALWVILMSRGTTLGKLIFGLRVRRTDGSNPGFWTMLLREWVGKTISYAIFGLGYWWAVWDKDRQAWHDKIAGTVVVAG